MSRPLAQRALIIACAAGFAAGCAHHRAGPPTTIGQLSDRVTVRQSDTAAATRDEVLKANAKPKKGGAA